MKTLKDRDYDDLIRNAIGTQKVTTIEHSTIAREVDRLVELVEPFSIEWDDRDALGGMVRVETQRLVSERGRLGALAGFYAADMGDEHQKASK